MKKTEINKEEFLSFIKNIPHWCTTKEHFEIYAEHLKYRLFQAKKQIEKMDAFVKDKCPQIYDEYLDSTMELYMEIDVLYASIPLTDDSESAM